MLTAFVSGSVTKVNYINCLLQFARLEDAKNAQSLNSQLEIGGRTIKVLLICL
jgi:hypothetical protein